MVWSRGCIGYLCLSLCKCNAICSGLGRRGILDDNPMLQRLLQQFRRIYAAESPIN
jgi:hypothetical protein